MTTTPPITPLLPAWTFESIYCESGESLRSSYSADSFTFAHPTSEHDAGYSEGHPTLRSDSWSFIAPQPYNTRSSLASRGTRRLHTSGADSGGTALSESSSHSTALPLYEPPLSPPSFHTVEPTSSRRSMTSIHPSLSTLSLSRAGSAGRSYIFALSPLF